MTTDSHARRQLNLAGQMLVALIFVAGVALCIWVGWIVGAIYGLERAEPIVNAPSLPGPGLAPNLGPLLGGAAELGRGIVTGIAAGLVGGVLAMFVISRLVIAPLLLRIPPLTARHNPGETDNAYQGNID